MKTLYRSFALLFLALSLGADDAAVALSYDNFTFKNSKQKYEGQRVSTYGAYTTQGNKLEAMYERAVTQTYQPPLDDDLKVNKYYLKYKQQLNQENSLSFEYIYIDDNIMVGGKNKYGKLLPKLDNTSIYALGYRYKAFEIVEYYSDYENFDVYQTDLSYKLSHSFENFDASVVVLGKYIYLDDKDQEAALKNALSNYYTAGAKLHVALGSYRLGAAALFGKRIFAVMFDGFRVQHHPMEIDKTYMAGITKHFEDFELQAKYVYQRAKEVPLNNENVIIQNIILTATYHF